MRVLWMSTGALVLFGAAHGACSASKETAASSAITAVTTAGVGGNGGGLSTSSGGEGGACIGDSYEAEPLPLDILIMLDQSGSMSQSAGNNLTKWETVKQAITAFVQQPNVEGISLALQYFGLPQPLIPGCSAQACTTDLDCTGGCGPCGSSGLCLAPFNPDIDSCDAIDYAWAEVPMQPLPDVAGPILTSLQMHAPGTNTPTKPALEGAIMYATNWQNAHPDHVTVVTFATDGEPAVCDTDMNNIYAVAAAGFNGMPSIKTFVVGVGGAFSALDGIAAAGGTTSAFHVDLNTMATQQFVDALNAIRNAALPCSYQIPPPPQGMLPDYTRVNVVYTPGGGPEQTIPKVPDAAHCPPNGLGWYYDDERAPTQIFLCDATCALIKSDLMAKLDIVLGCITIVE